MRFSRPLLAAFASGIILGIAGTAVASTLRGSSVFTDVEPGAYYDTAIGDLYSAGIVKGLDTDHFGPNDNISRGQVAVMIDRLRNELLGNVTTVTSSSSRSSSSFSSTSSASSSSSSVGVRPAQGSFRLTASTYSVNENDGNLTIGVVRVGGATGQATINYAVTPGTATAGQDYTPISGTLVFGDGSTSKTLTLQILDDALVEGNENMTITLSNPTGGAIDETPTSAVITIIDNEQGASSNSSAGSTGSSSSANPAGTLGFGATSYSVAENGGNLTVTVNRAGGSNGTVTVAYATSNNTAKSGTDYTATSGTLTFSSGQTSQTFTVPIANDSSIQGARKFNLTISTPTGGATLDTTSAVVTILDDDTNGFSFGSGSVKFSSSTLNVQEGQDAVVTVSRIGGTMGTVSVAYATQSSGLASTNDYTATSGTLTFQPGEASKTIHIPTTKDNISDGGEDFSIWLSNPSSNTTIVDPSNETITIDE